MKLKINGEYYEGKSGETLLELARRNNINIPSLCYKKGFEGLGRCRLCLVEVKEGNKTKVVSSCIYPIQDGIEVTTNSEKVLKMRKDIIKLLLLRTPNNEYIKVLANEYEILVPERYMNKNEKEDCILCGLCIKACEKIGTNAIAMVNRGIYKKVSTPYDDASKDCIGCGACAEVCPTGAISLVDMDGKRTIWNKAFNLVQCSICGSYYTTEEALNYIKEKIDNEVDELICENCKRKITGEKFKEIYKSI